MKHYTNYVLLALLLGGAGSCQSLHAAAVTLPSARSITEFLSRWRLESAGEGILAASQVFSNKAMIIALTVGIVGLVLCASSRPSAGMRRLFHDMNHIAAGGGLHGIAQQVALGLGGALGNGEVAAG